MAAGTGSGTPLSRPFLDAHSTPPITASPAMITTGSTCSPNASQEEATPTIGTSIENGATSLDGCRASRPFQSPYPIKVAINTM